jgi:hypothetical protein
MYVPDSAMIHVVPPESEEVAHLRRKQDSYPNAALWSRPSGTRLSATLRPRGEKTGGRSVGVFVVAQCLQPKLLERRPELARLEQVLRPD